ncbi:hypothetical protein EC973_005016 [Apophysomyces ossiformis]|uniref:Glucose-methanol-choline oxidoreductase N-terminal domain-containing protein n=1 Tax=Apophysomyces ossiformis TaxID=679940 RepID=A0A8H7ELF8_9FUNG|nr:hypothetical protein EC973_005016 [Apophysomyces ossiformis]
MGGTAGCVLANRLSREDNQVLVLEAGTQIAEDVWESRIPGLNSQLKDSTADWALKTTPQSNAHNRTLDIPLGKLLGGCSGINAMVWHQCSPDDYNDWHVPGWSYNDLEPYFRKAETMTDNQGDTAIHGTEGPMKVTHQSIKADQLGEAFRQACMERGLPAYRDITGRPEQIGVSELQASIWDGRRFPSSKGYLSASDAMARPKLEIGLGCHVARIVFQDKRACKVVFEQDQSTYEAYVREEIVLCAGAIHSPHLLMRSGIGPAEDLEAHQIPLVHDLPGVGKNLTNHWRVPLVHETKPSYSLHRSLFSTEIAPYTYYDAWAHGKGALTRIWPDAVAYFRLPDVPDTGRSKGTPQFELFAGGLALCHLLPQLKEVDCATLLLVLLTPFSRGSVKLGPGESVVVDPCLLKDERDLECLEKAVEYSLSIAENKHYRPSVQRWILAPDSLGIRDYVREHAESIHHYAGTCKMGDSRHPDPMMVVDEELRVVGLRKLRVMDASIFPTLPAGQICFPVIACAERAADLILKTKSG